MKELFVSLKNPFFPIEKKGFFDGKRGGNDIKYRTLAENHRRFS
jgi:hypothetical protein